MVPMKANGLDPSVSFLPLPRVLVAYSVFFSFGWLLFTRRDLVPSFGRHAWPYFGAGLVMAVVYMIVMLRPPFTDALQSHLAGVAAFNYPSPSLNPETESNLGVGEHTDYGLLTILRQDMSGGLQVKTKSGWVAAPPIPNGFVCNIGDMLDRMTGGHYLSTPHRVWDLARHNRLSFPFFFDPNFNAEVRPIEINEKVNDNREERWDRASVHEFRGTYGDYLLSKVSKVFPELRGNVLS